MASALAGLLLAGCGRDEGVIKLPPYEPPDTLTTVFRDGISPDSLYDGTRDAVLKDGPTAEIVYGNSGDAETDTFGTVLLGDYYYERRLVLRMDLSGITDCAKVTAVRLTLRLEREDKAPLTMYVYRIVLPEWMPSSWVEGAGTGVSWVTMDGTAPWVSEGGDYENILLDTRTVSSDTSVTFALPGSLALNWIQEPGDNHGVIIMSPVKWEESFTLVHMRESAAPEKRPRLEVKYIENG